MNKNKEVEEYISKAGVDHQSILQSLRDLIAGSVPEVQEQFKWGQPVYGTVKDFVYLKHTKKHVNLGFFNFEKVDDSDGLLEGTGARMRHIKITDLKEMDLNRLQEMIIQAASI